MRLHKRQNLFSLLLAGTLCVLSAMTACDGSDMVQRRREASMPLQLKTLSRGQPQDLNLVILPEAFRQEDMGLFMQKVDDIRDALQVAKPFCYLLDRINIYCSTTLVSETDRLGSGRTALGCGQVSGRTLPLDDDSIAKAFHSTGLDIGRTVLLVLVNTDAYAGCAFFDGNKCYVACAAFDGYLPTTAIHELGHAIGWLDDEYAEQEMPSDADLAEIRSWQAKGYFLNVATDAFDVPWKGLLDDRSYQKETPGIYEGAALFKKGVFRSSPNSVMRTHLCGHNTVGRYLIYKRIMSFHTGEVPAFDMFRNEDLACNVPDIRWLELLSPAETEGKKAKRRPAGPGMTKKSCIIRKNSWMIGK